jgi:hypothetical protein
MKRLYTMVMSALVLAFLTNCAPSNNSTKAADKMDSGCFMLQLNQISTPTRANCNYNFGSTSGFSAFNTTRGYAYTGATAQTIFAQGCTNYTQPVYSELKGLGCVDSRNLNYAGQPAIYSLDSSSANFVLTSQAVPYYAQNQYSQSGWNSNYSYTNASQYSGINVLRACDTSEPCPGGQVCRSPYSDTSLGLCYF